MTNPHSLKLSRHLGWNRFFGVAAALLTLGVSAHALTLGEIEIARKLPPSSLPIAVKLRRATPTQLLAAYKAAVASPVNPRATTTSIVSAAAIYIPQFGPDIATTALNKVRNASASLAAKSLQANTIMTVVVRRGLLGNATYRPVDKAAVAAAITSAAVNALKDLPSTDPQFSSAVRGAVTGGFLYGVGSRNGAAGAVTGAIAAAANVGTNTGSGNANFELGATTADAGDKLINVIIRSAVSRAPSRILEIAEASGYALAVAYRATQFTGTQITVSAFLTNNLADLVTSLRAGLNPVLAARLATQLSDRVQAGIALAYAAVATNGSTGFAYNNGVLTPVTDTTGR